jgi:FG-GAP-like repeat
VVRISGAIALAAALLGAGAAAQNPVPHLSTVTPTAVAPGSGGFTLTVYGANFVPGAVVNWNYQARSTTFVSARELQAQILATDVAVNTAGLISVTNPAPGGGRSSSSWAQVEVHAPVSTISVRRVQPYDFGFWVAMLADFTNSTTLDLVGGYGSYLAYAPGRGNGAFPFGSIIGGYYFGLLGTAYGDFNGDGNLDVVFGSETTENGAREIKAFLGDGAGNFRLSSNFPYEKFPGVLVAGDFNGDGKLDLAVDGGALGIFLGNGDGTFTLKSSESTAWGFGLVTGDFNGDGKLDLAVLENPLPNNNNNGLAVYVLIGNGDGTFKFRRKVYSDPTTEPCGAQMQLKIGDFNGDGKLDLAYCDQRNEVVILFGKGDGTFPTSAVLSDGNGIYSFAIGDVNSDGIPDVIVAEITQQLEVQAAVYLGNGDGTFQASQPIKMPSAPNGELGLEVGDIDADGLLDFIFQNNLGMQVITR